MPNVKKANLQAKTKEECLKEKAIVTSTDILGSIPVFILSLDKTNITQTLGAFSLI
jgi:hypothetical protein